MPRDHFDPPGDRERLEHMLKAAQDAISYVHGRTRQELDIDSQLLRALTNCVQVIGEAAARTSDAGRARASSLPWSKMVGMRHILVHAYYAIDADAVWRVVHDDLPGLIKELQATLAAWPDKNELL